MQRIAQFEFVSAERWRLDWERCVGGALPPLPPGPRRATAGSAGYDFFAPADVALEPGKKLFLPTGIRARMEPGWVLLLAPRSSLGFKYGLRLDNTVGIIDSDYYGAKNEGHICLCLQSEKPLRLSAGEAIVQGIFLPYGISLDDCADATRQGGFGSTNGRNAQ